MRRIFALYLRPNATTVSVARKLTTDPDVNAEWGDWSARRVRYILDNQAYIGKLIGGRYSRPVGVKSGGTLPRADWIVVNDGVPPIVTRDVFEAAQRKRQRNRTPVTFKAALGDLRRIGADHGYISQGLIRRFARWSPGVYYRQVGPMPAIRDLLNLPVPAKFANHHLFQGDMNRHGRGKPLMQRAGSYRCSRRAGWSAWRGRPPFPPVLWLAMLPRLGRRRGCGGLRLPPCGARPLILTGGQTIGRRRRLQPSFRVSVKNYLHELYTAFFHGKIVLFYR